MLLLVDLLLRKLPQEHQCYKVSGSIPGYCWGFFVCFCFVFVLFSFVFFLFFQLKLVDLEVNI